MAHPEDADLVLRTRSGDKEAYCELVSRYQGHVYGLAYSLVNNWVEAQDIAQETFIHAYMNLDQIRYPARFAAWLRRVAFGIAMNWLKAFRRGLFDQLDGRVDLDDLEVPDFKPGAPEVIQNRELATAVLQAIDSLPPKYRLPLTMFHLDGLSYKKVADFLDIPLGTVKMLIHRARAKLKTALADYAGEEISPMVQEVFNEHKLGKEFARRILNDLPPGRGDSNSLAQGLHMLLDYCGTQSDYDTIMGDTGQAFIIQSEEGGPLIDGAVDVGWWPLASWGLKTRLSFLGQAVGREIREIKGSADAYRADPAAHFREYLEPAVRASIASGRPLLATLEPWFVVAGYDEEEPPLLGDCSIRDGRIKMRRIDKYPWGLIVLGEERRRIDRKKADLESLRHAVALGTDALRLTLPPFAAEWEKMTRSCFTGQRSFALWAEALRDMERLGQARWHANMCYQLRINRRSAIAYLRAMTNRHDDKAAGRLAAAADIYQDELRRLRSADTTKPAMMSGEGRQSLAHLVESIANLERQATAEVEKALQAIEAE